MPRANRHFLPDHVWHITHRCHKQEFLLKFSKDRKNWIKWLYEAKKRYGLCVLNYIVTSNHIHLLVKDTEEDAIPKSLQLIAGRTAQQYNQRKSCKGAYWEDRYHATNQAGESYSVRSLSQDIGISASEISIGTRRLVVERSGKIFVESGALLEWLCYGVRYAYPPESTGYGWGMATAWNCPVLVSEVVPPSPPLVWPVPGEEREIISVMIWRISFLC